MAYLQLVLAGLSLRGRVQEIDCENLYVLCQPLYSIHRFFAAFRAQSAVSVYLQADLIVWVAIGRVPRHTAQRHRHFGEV